MRKHVFYVLSVLCGLLWIGVVFILNRSEQSVSEQLELTQSELTQKGLKDRVDELEGRVADQVQENSLLLKQIKQIRSSLREESQLKQRERIRDDNRESLAEPKHVIPILLFSCNRMTVRKALDLLLSYRPDQAQFPIIVSQDCGHQETAEVIAGYGDKIISIQQPDLSEPQVPKKEKKFRGYFKIARHYGWALNQTFNTYGHEQVVIVEDDLEVAPDFYEYFTATLPLLKADKSLWCVSAWNDNGKQGLIDETAGDLLYRTDFFPGLGWMITKDLWEELSPKWPRSYWDDWMREPAQRQNRACIRPEISRTKTFGKIGVSNGLFFDKHLKFIVLSTKFVPFLSLDLSYLNKDNYDASYVADVNKYPAYSLEDIRQGKNSNETSVRLIYRTRENFKKSSKMLGIMDDFKSGVPRMAYRGIVSFMYRGRRVYLAPNLNWQGYNPQWA